MSGKFQEKASEYNKDEKFASISIDETSKVTFTEAIAKDSNDDYITVYGWVDSPLVGVERFGDRMWVYEPQLCKVKIPKRDSEREYQGKKTVTKCSPGMKAAVHLISAHGFDTPFSGLFDFSMAPAVAKSIINGKGQGGVDLNAAELAMLGQYFMRLEPLEKLEKLEGVEIKEQGKGGSYGRGGGGQKESERLADRLAFIKVQMTHEGELAAICKTLYGEQFEPALDSHIVNLLNSLFN